MNHLIRALGLVACVALPLAAQAPGAQRSQVLRGRVEAAFIEQLSRQLALTDDQRAVVTRVLAANGERRRGLESEEVQLQHAIRQQLRPGVAANSDSVARLVDRLAANRVEYAQSFQSEMRELSSTLTPVQRAQLLLLRDQVFRRVQELQQERRPAGAAPGGVRRPGP
jgi:hypothetical protein